MDKRLLLVKDRRWRPAIGDRVFVDAGGGTVKTVDVLKECERWSTNERIMFKVAQVGGEFPGYETSQYRIHLFPMTDDNIKRALLRTPVLSITEDQMPEMQAAFAAFRAGQL